MISKCIVAFILLFCVGTATSQSANKGYFTFDLEGGAAAYSFKSNESHDTGGGLLSANVGLALGYNTHHGLNVSLEINTQNFYLDSLRGGEFSASAFSNDGCLKLQYSIVNKERFQYYIGAKAGFCGFTVTAADSAGSQGILNMTGTCTGAFTGFKKYFGKSFGVKAELGFVRKAMWGESFTIDDEPQTDLTNWLAFEDYKVSLTGLYANIGITFNFGNPKD